MELMEFFYPEQSQAKRLREIAQTLREGNAAKQSAARISNSVQDDVNTLALVCMALVGTLVEKGVITELELQMHMQAADGLDAVDDDGLDPNVLRGALGMKKSTPKPGKKKALPRNAKLRKPAAKGGPPKPKR